MIPDDLQAVCVLPYNEDIAPFFPPAIIATAVERIISERGEQADTELVEQWINAQRGLQERAEVVIARMKEDILDCANDGLPGWINDKWAFQIHCPWSEHLEQAVIEGEGTFGIE